MFLLVLASAAMLASCASTGSLNYEGNKYTFNESDVVREEDGRLRVWAWEYERDHSLDIVGSSSAGIQMLLPSDVQAGTVCDIGEGCMLWVRGFYYVLGDLLGVLWMPAESGAIMISEWDIEKGTCSGNFEALTEKGPASGRFRARVMAEL